MLNILKYPRFLSKMIKANSLLVCLLYFFVICAVLGFLCQKGRTVVAQKAQNKFNQFWLNYKHLQQIFITNFFNTNNLFFHFGY